jgi:hypothetical protein
MEPIACLWDVHCVYYKNLIKSGYVTDFLAKMYVISTIEFRKIATDYLSIVSILIEAGISSRYFLPIFCLLSPIFWSKISKSLFLKLTKFVNPEPYVTREEGFVPNEVHP